MNNWPGNFPQHQLGVVRRASSYGPIIVELEASDLGSVRTNASTLQRRYLLHNSQSFRSTNRPYPSNAPTARKLYNRRLGARPHVIQVSDSASRVGTQSQQPQHTRPWRQVNEDVSARMIAMSSDSPPVIPKRDYEDSPRPRGQQLQSTIAGEQSGEDVESSEDGRQRVIDESSGQLVVYQGGRPPHGAFDGSIYGGEPMGFMPCPPGPMWPMPIPMPPMFPPPPPPPPPPFFHPGMDGFQPYVCTDPGILFTPMGPMPVFDASQHRRNHKKAMKRSQSLELRSCGPPSMFMPPPGAPFMPPMGFQENLPMPMPGGPPQMMMLNGTPSMMMPMQRPMMGRMAGTGKRPVKAKPPKTPKKHSACYLVCCKGHTQVLWIVVGIILVGIVLGLVLGLTLV